jgi:predicted nucleic acid-binding protein
MVYLDSNVFVYAVTHDPARYGKAKKAIAFLRSIEEGEIEGATSFLTWDELTWVVWKLEGTDAGVRSGEALLKLDNLSLLPVNFSVMHKAQELIDKYQLKPRDSIHVASALMSGEKEIISDDAELDSVREIKRHSLN